MERTHITFIYYCRSCDKWFAMYFDCPDTGCPHCNSKDMIHSATVDPAIIISRFLNNDLNVVNDCIKFAKHQMESRGAYE